MESAHWALYIATVCRRLSQNFGRLKGCDVAIVGDLPLASGMSHPVASSL